MMKMISKILVVCLSLVFSLIVSGPAFSALPCSSQMAQMSVKTGSSYQKMHDHQKTQMKECCHSMDCLSFSSATVQTRFYEVEPLALINIVWHVRLPEADHVKALELFHNLKMKQGPPLLLASSYKVHLARTTRQNI